MEDTQQHKKMIEMGKASEAGISYLLKPVPERLLKAGDERSAFVQVIPNRTIRKSEFIGKIVEKSMLDASAVTYVINKMTEVLLRELRAGNTVSIDDHFMFGVSIPGRVSPIHPEAVRDMKIVPTLRFSPPFHRAINQQTTVHYLADFQPTQVRVDSLYNLGSGCEAEGYFHNLLSLKIEMLIGDAAIPCRFELFKDSASTRDIGRKLTIIPKVLPPPPGPRKVRFSYLESTGVRKTFTVDSEDRGW